MRTVAQIPSPARDYKEMTTGQCEDSKDTVVCGERVAKGNMPARAEVATLKPKNQTPARVANASNC